MSGPLAISWISYGIRPQIRKNWESVKVQLLRAVIFSLKLFQTMKIIILGKD